MGVGLIAVKYKYSAVFAIKRDLFTTLALPRAFTRLVIAAHDFIGGMHFTSAFRYSPRDCFADEESATRLKFHDQILRARESWRFTMDVGIDKHPSQTQILLQASSRLRVEPSTVNNEPLDYTLLIILPSLEAGDSRGNP